MRLLHRYAVATAASTFGLLIAGALVTSTGSGLAVPDWPLSYGTWMPPMVGGIAYEHGHRMIAAFVGLLIIGLAVWCARAEPRRWVRRLGAGALAGVVLQGLLGGLTVLLLLPPQISIAHACLGQTVFCLVVSLALCTSPGWQARRAWPLAEAPRSLPALSGAVLALAATQLILGAVIRHTGHAVGWHLLGAAALLLMSGWFAAAVRRTGEPILRRGAGRLIHLVAAQILLGLSVFTHRGSVALRTGHVALGALVLAQAVTLAWEIFPRVRRTSRARLPADLLELTKARLSALVLVTTAAGFWMGLPPGGSALRLLPLLLGTALVVGGANALNQWMEREPDGLMERTKHRPVPAGRISPEAAWRFGVCCAAGGLLVLAASVNGASALLACAGLVSYVLIYTPMKRRTPLCTLVGAIPGALPPLIGWAGARGTVGAEAWALFAILFVWQLPHFLALALLHRADYARAGFRMLPLMESDGLTTARQMVLYGLALLPASLCPTVLGVAGPAYFYGALLLGLGFVAFAARAAWQRTPRAARQLFFASILYLPVLLGLMVLDPVSATAKGSTTKSAAAVPLGDYGGLPEFSLMDHRGAPFTRRQLTGRVSVADFVFTRCAGQCPMMHDRMRTVARALAGEADLQLLSFSVDPAHDTLDTLAAFAGTVTDGETRWRFITGDERAVTELAGKGFRLAAGGEGSAEESITHSTRLVLIDRGGHVRGYYDAADAAASARLARDARRLLRAR